MVHFPFNKSNRVRDMTIPMETIPVHMAQPKLAMIKSSVVFDVFDYTTCQSSPKSEDLQGLQLVTSTKLELKFGNDVDIWLQLEGQFSTATEVLDFSLKQKLNVNRDWKEPEEIDPILKPKLYNDLYEAFSTKFNKLFPDYKIAKLPSRNGIELRARLVN